MTEQRPDVVGMVSVWSGDQVWDIGYFSSEEEAREGEKKEMPEEHRKMFEDWQSVIQDTKYLDIADPWIY